MITPMKEPREAAVYLKEHGVKPSVIRIKVMQFLSGTKEHPTADSIYKKLIKDIPTLSKTSIYNTLKLFSTKGVVKEVKVEDGEVRYDGDIGKHAHFKCVKCGKLDDVEVACEFKACTGAAKGKIIDAHVYIMGICEQCLAKGAKRNG
jgi:Fur family transcriptional regulator, peroxide stress response regulator